MGQADPPLPHIPVPDRQDWYGPDEHLRWLLRDSVGEAMWPVADAALRELGELVPRRIEQLAVDADRHPPVLQQYDARGAPLAIGEATGGAVAAALKDAEAQGGVARGI